VGVGRADISDVKATIEAHHQALASLDIAKMDVLRAHDDAVMDKGPNAKSTTLGWTGMRRNFEGCSRRLRRFQPGVLPLLLCFLLTQGSNPAKPRCFGLSPRPTFLHNWRGFA
jgi:hypothetical protein